MYVRICVCGCVRVTVSLWLNQVYVVFMIATAVASSQQLITNSYIIYNLFSSLKGIRHYKKEALFENTSTLENYKEDRIFG